MGARNQQVRKRMDENIKMVRWSEAEWGTAKEKKGNK